MADGSIIFEVNTDTSKAEANIEEMKNKLEDTTTLEVKTKGVEQAENDLRSLDKQKQGLNKSTTMNIDTKGTENATKSVEGVGASVDDTKKQMFQFGEESKQSFDKFVDGTFRSVRALRSPRAMISMIAKTVKDLGGAVLFGNVKDNIGALESQMSETLATTRMLKDGLATTRTELETLQDRSKRKTLFNKYDIKTADDLHRTIESLTSQSADYERRIGEQTKLYADQRKQIDELRQAEEARQTAKNMAKSLGIMLAITLAIKLISKYVEHLKKQREEMLKNLKAIGEYIGRTLLDIVKGTFNLMVERTKAVASAISNLSTVISGFLASLLDIKGTSLMDFLESANDETSRWNIMLTQVRQQWSYLSATIGAGLQNVFYPLLEVLSKVLSYLQYIADVFLDITGSIFGISGKALDNLSANTKTATDNMNDLADAIDETQNGLADFDKLNVLSQQKETSSKDTVKGIQDNLNISVNDFGKVGIIQRIKDAIKNGDWFSVGRQIGESLSNSLDRIDWVSIKKKLKGIATNLANLLNGFVKGTNWRVIGKAIAEAINTYLTTANTFLQTFDFYGFGEAIAQAFVEWLNKVDVKEYGRYIANLFNTIIKTSAGFISRFTEMGGWTLLAKSIVDGFNAMLEQIDTHNLATGVSELILGVLDLITVIGTREVNSKGETIFEVLGTKIGDTLGRTLTNILSDPTRLANAIKSIVSSITNFVKNFFTAVGDEKAWYKIGSGVGDVISEVLSDEEFIQNILDTVELVTKDLTALIEGFLASETVDWQNLAKIWFGIKGGYESVSKKITDVLWGVTKAVGETWYQRFSNWASKNANFSPMGLIGLIFGFDWSEKLEQGLNSFFNFFENLFNGKLLFGGTNHSTSKYGEKIGNDLARGTEQGYKPTIDYQSALPTTEQATASGMSVGNNFASGTSNGFEEWCRANNKMTPEELDRLVAGTSYDKAGTTLGTQFNTGFVDKATSDKVKAEQMLSSSIDRQASNKGYDLGYALSNAFKDVIFSIPNAFIDMLNSMIDRIRNFRIGGIQPFGNIGYIPNVYNIPKLATGMYVPANYGSFLAELGDNRREPEVVSPISYIKEAVADAVGNQAPTELHIYLDGNEVFNTMVEKDKSYKKAHGYSAFAR